MAVPQDAAAPTPAPTGQPSPEGVAADRARAAHASRIATVGLVVQAILALGSFAVAVATGSFAALGVAAHVAAGACAWAAGAFLAGRRARIADERFEQDRLARAALDEGRRPLFLAGETAREGGEGRIGALLALGLALVEAGLGAFLVLHGIGRAAVPASGLLGGAAAFAGSSFVLLLLAKYSLGLLPSHEAGRAGSATPLLLAAPGARRAASGALASLAGAVVLALLELAPSLQLDLAGYVFAGLEGALALELVLALVLELYRPRKRGEVARPPFESRLLSLVAEPSGIARSLARAVDYQFGFQLSETWAYRLVERGVVPLALFLAGATWLLSCFVVVPAGERAILARFGVPSPALLEPGLHAKLPWPFETTTEVEVARVREVVLGHAPDDDDDEAVPGRARAILWTTAHAKDEFHILVARPRSPDGAPEDGSAASAPVSFLAASAPVHFVVEDAVAFATRASDPEGLLKAIGERELGLLGCTRSLDELIAKRGEAAIELARRIQESASAHGLGVRILDVGLEDLHPPIEVATAFHSVTGALEEGEARRLAQRAYAARVRPMAEGDARQIRDRARSEAGQKALLAEADAARYRALVALDRAAPRVFRPLSLLRGLEDSFEPGRRRVVVARGAGAGQVEIDLGEKLDSFDLGAPPETPQASGTNAPKEK